LVFFVFVFFVLLASTWRCGCLGHGKCLYTEGWKEGRREERGEGRKVVER
jgi:hypothetical protein